MTRVYSEENGFGREVLSGLVCFHWKKVDSLAVRFIFLREGDFAGGFAPGRRYLLQENFRTEKYEILKI